MPPILETPGLAPFLRHAAAASSASVSASVSSHDDTDTDNHPHHRKRSKLLGGIGGGGGVFKMFKLLPMLSTGCKMVALLGRPKHAMLPDRAGTTVTLFGPRRGRLFLAIQDDPRSPPLFLIELPLLTSSLHKEMASGPVRIALESDTRSHRRKLLEEYVWAVYCNGRKSGFAIRRKSSSSVQSAVSSEDEKEVMRVLRGVSMGAGVLPERPGDNDGDGSSGGDQVTYMRARFERVVGSKDSEALYMINPDTAAASAGPEISIFFVRPKG